MNQVKLKINGTEITAAQGTTILEAATSVGIDIPTLCHMKGLSPSGACRICVVELPGRPNLVPACAYPVAEGMEVLTHSPRVIRARKTLVELLLANHPDDCLVCIRNGNCELQKLASDLGIRERRYTGKRRQYHLDATSPSLERDPNKCILCGRCVRVCEEIQSVGAIDFVGRGFETLVLPAFNEDIYNTECVNCGQCIIHCPTGALRERSSLAEVWNAINEPETHVVAQVAPAVRVSIGEEFGLEPGTILTGQIISALRRLNFDRVFDTQFGADLTVVEEASELLHRLKTGGRLPLITSCSPGWVKHLEHSYPQLIANLSSCKSPQQMFGAVTKSFYAHRAGIDPSKLFVVSIMPCTAKKFEAQRPEMEVDGIRDVDAVLTTRELARMLKIAGIDISKMPVSEFDDPLGSSSGAAALFGATGGVMEAALRTAYHLLTGQDLGEIPLRDVRGLDGIKETVVEVAGIELRCAVAHGLSNAGKLLDSVIRGDRQYHFIEIMGCPGGCIGGGGQPRARDLQEALNRRMQAIYKIDAEKQIRRSDRNPAVIRLYDEFLGEPLGELSHKFLHTRYVRRGAHGVAS